MKVYKAPFIGRGVTLITPSSLPSVAGQYPSWNTNGTFAGWTLTSPGGLTTEIQINNAGVFGGITGSSWATGVLTVPTLAVTDLTAGRIPYVGTAGRLVDSSALTFANSTISLVPAANADTYGIHLLTAAGLANALVTNCPNTGLLLLNSTVKVILQSTGGSGGIGTLSPSATWSVATPSSRVGLDVLLASGQTADAFQVTSYGGTAGDKLRIKADIGQAYIHPPYYDELSGYTLYLRTTAGQAISFGEKTGYSCGEYVVQANSSGTNCGLRLPASAFVGWTASNAAAALDTGLARNAAGIVEVNNGTAGQYRDVLVRSIGLGVAPSGVTGGINGNVTINATSGSSPGLTVYNTVAPFSTAQVRIGYNNTTYWDIGRDGSIDGRLFIYNVQGGTVGERVSIATGGATTINAVSGNPLTVQRNGVAAFIVDSSTSATLSGTASNLILHATTAGQNAGITFSEATIDKFTFYLNGGDDTLRVYNVADSNYSALSLDASGRFGVNVGAAASARIHAISTTEQLRLGYDAADYCSFTVGPTGNTTFAITTGTSTTGFVFSNPISCPGVGAASERFGAGATAAGVCGFALGGFTVAANAYSVAIGYAANSSHNSSIAIGGVATTTVTNQLMIGSTTSPINAMKLITDAVGGSLNFGVTSGVLTITPSGGSTTLVGSATVSSGIIKFSSTVGYSNAMLKESGATLLVRTTDDSTYGNIAASTVQGIATVISPAYWIGSYQGLLQVSGSGASSDTDMCVYNSFRVRNIGNTNHAPISAGVGTFNGTIGTKVLSLVSTATNDDPQLDIYQNRVATTDATVTTLHTIAIADETAYALTATVLAHRTGGSAGTAGDSALYTFQACVMRTGAGIATMVGASTPIVTLESQAAWDCVFDVDGGNNARIRFTGALNNNITIHLVELKVSPLST